MARPRTNSRRNKKNVTTTPAVEQLDLKDVLTTTDNNTADSGNNAAALKTDDKKTESISQTLTEVHNTKTVVESEKAIAAKENVLTETENVLQTTEVNQPEAAPKKRGRKPGSKNKPKEPDTTTAKGRARALKNAKTSEAEDKPAKRRGRPKKTEIKAATEAKATNDSKATTAAPKKTKKASIETNICYQVPGREINEDAIYDWIKFVWTSELGRKESDIKSIAVYLKPAENAIYYVVNNDYAGKLDF